MTMRNRFCLAATLVTLAISPLQASDTVLRVGYSYWLPNVPLDIAEGKGWWKNAGLEVELKRFVTTQEVMKALKDREIDLATDMIGTWIDTINRGEDLLILGETDWSHGGDKILLKKDANIAALKGAPVAVYIRNLAVQHFLGEFLRSKNLALSDYQVVEVSDDAKIVDLFTTGKIKALVYYEPVVNEMAEKGNGQIVATTADFPGVMPEGFVARRGFYKSTPRETFVQFFRVWFRAAAYSLDPANAAEVAKTATEKTFAGTATYEADGLAEELAKVPIHSPERAAVENGPDGNLQKYLRRAQASLQRTGALNSQINAAMAIDTSALIEAAKSPK